MPYHTLIDSHIVFQRGLHHQVTSDTKHAILIFGGTISNDALRNLQILGILWGPLFPCYGNILGVEPTCHTQNKLFFIFFHHGLLWRQPAMRTSPFLMENPYKEALKKITAFVSIYLFIYWMHLWKANNKSLWEETEGIIKAIKRAQIMGFVPVTYKDPAYLKDYKVCNIKYQE
uniref:Uncharacterized protein n=1 Tax=Canis lupus dingo TaxID=286419 RepID=A0A8C0R2R0_CANLU